MKVRFIALALSLAGVAASPAAAEEYVVTLTSSSFIYNGQTNDDIELTILPGDSVRWVWESGVHNVVSGDPGDPDEGMEFDSGAPVGPPNEFVHVFDEPGDFEYFCEIHFFMGMESSVSVRCAADFNGDLTVNTQDVLSFLNAWNARDPRSDFNGDGTINTQDVLAFLNAWTGGC